MPFAGSKSPDNAPETEAKLSTPTLKLTLAMTLFSFLEIEKGLKFSKSVK